MITQGSQERPVDLGPFARIVEVGWSVGRIGVLTITLDTGAGFAVRSLDPPDLFPEPLPPASTVLRSDYAEKSILAIDGQVEIERIPAIDELHPLLLDDFVGGGAHHTGNPAAVAIFEQDIAAAEARQGRSADIVYIGATWRDVMTTHTHPNGSQTTYRSGVQPVSFTPPDFDWSEWDTYLWTSTSTLPGADSLIIRRNWLFNFGKNAIDPFAVQVGIIVRLLGDPMPYTYPVELKIYPYGTEFEALPDGTLSTERPPLIHQTKQWPHDLFNWQIPFDKKGFLGDIPP